MRQAARATFGAFASRWPARAAALKATLQASSQAAFGQVAASGAARVDLRHTPSRLGLGPRIVASPLP